MTGRRMTPAEQAQMAMMLEVTAYPKPGNVDRCHDYPGTRLEHFLASVILSRPSLERASEPGAAWVPLSMMPSPGRMSIRAVIPILERFSSYSPYYGKDIPGAISVTRNTTVEDAVEFYKAFGMTQVRVLASDTLDVNDPPLLKLSGGKT